METTTRILDQHQVGAVVLACIDFRFREGLAGAIREAFHIDAWDEVKLAGGAKNISMPRKEGRAETAFDDLALAISAHHAHTVILLNHQNCGKYAAEGHIFSDIISEQAFHTLELKKAGDITRKRFPAAIVLLGYASADPNDRIVIHPIKLD